MGETHLLTIELPSDLFRMVKDKVAAGEYSSESELVRESLEAFGTYDAPSDGWIRAEVLPVYKACQEDPSRLIPADDVFDRLKERYRQDMRALGREP